MFEFHGWAVIQSTSGRRVFRPDGLYFPDDELLHEQLNAHIDQFNVREWVHFHRTVNGFASLTFSGLRNHRDERIVGVFKWLAVHAQRSYGFLFTRDAEDEVYSQFRIFRLANGQFEALPDFLAVPEVPELPQPEYEPDAQP
jgi:hypothetical protein